MTGQWYTWTPANGPLQVGPFADGENLASIWVPNPHQPITVTDNAGVGHPYRIQAVGAEIVPVNIGATLATLSGTSTYQLYVYASSLPFNPYKSVGSADLYPTQTASYDGALPAGTKNLTVNLTPGVQYNVFGQARMVVQTLDGTANNIGVFSVAGDMNTPSISQVCGASGTVTAGQFLLFWQNQQPVSNASTATAHFVPGTNVDRSATSVNFLDLWLMAVPVP